MPGRNTGQGLISPLNVKRGESEVAKVTKTRRGGLAETCFVFFYFLLVRALVFFPLFLRPEVDINLGQGKKISKQMTVL